MYGYPRPLIPNDIQWNRHRAPHHNPQWRPFHRPHAPFRPRNQSYNNHRPPIMQGGSEEHWCETCDRGFPNEDLLYKHKQQHQKCNIDGCQFIAHPKVITKHIQMQHSSGLYKKIANLNNPEEIEKWREERKKKYPTKINIDKKAAELKEKIDRGEKMNLNRRNWQSKRDENNQNRDFNSEQGTKRPYNNANNNHPAPKFRKPRKQKPKILPAPEENRSLIPFAGIQCLQMDTDEEVDENLNCNDLIEDEEMGTIEKVKRVSESDKSTDKRVCTALSSLMCEYGSSEDEIDDNQKTKQNLKNHEVSKEKIAMPQVNKESKSLPEKKHLNENAKINQAERKQPFPNSTTEPSKVLPMNTNSKVDFVINNVLNGSEGKPEEMRMSEKYATKINNKRKSENLVMDGNDKLNALNDDDDSGPEEVKVDKKDESVQENITGINTQVTNAKISKKKVEVVKRKPIYRKPKPKIPSTLIYRLLSKEMKQERNQVLQCIRYIRKNNYFDNDK